MHGVSRGLDRKLRIQVGKQVTLFFTGTTIVAMQTEEGKLYSSEKTTLAYVLAAGFFAIGIHIFCGAHWFSDNFVRVVPGLIRIYGKQWGQFTKRHSSAALIPSLKKVHHGKKVCLRFIRAITHPSKRNGPNGNCEVVSFLRIF